MKVTQGFSEIHDALHIMYAKVGVSFGLRHPLVSSGRVSNLSYGEYPELS